MNKVKILRGDKTKNKKIVNSTEISINGKPIRSYSVDYHEEVGGVPVFTIEIPGLPDIDVDTSDVQFRFHPDTIVESIKILRHEILNNETIYAGFLASIESALNEAKPYTSEQDLAKAILDRIIGSD